MSQLGFLVVAALILLCALGVILLRNAVHSALCLVLTLFFLALLFLGLDAELLAMLQVIVYAGAIVVLFLFVIMLLNVQTEGRSLSSPLLVGGAVVGGAALFVMAATGILRASGPARDLPALPTGFGSVSVMADSLFTKYYLPFELTSFLLLVAVVGAVAVAKRKM